MLQIKTFANTNLDDLEAEVNQWLTGVTGSSIKDINWAQAWDIMNNQMVFSVSVIFTA